MKINGKEYKIPEINITTIKELEKYGVCLMNRDMSNSVMTLLCGFMCLSANITVKQAEAELERRLLSGEGIKDLMEDINHALDASTFVNKMISNAKNKPKAFNFKSKKKLM